ncbi:MAG TPA: hypothetical protein VK737_08310, partial [Opitutales bacterium]|nr:hypothetical protein [Opitutales bacterium]
LALEKNLGQGDNSATLFDIASYFMEKSASLHPVTFADAQKWYQDNHPHLEAQAAILSGQPAPATPSVAPNCPEVTYHITGNPTISYSAATVTIDHTGLAHIAVQRAAPLTRDFPLSSELIAALRKIVADNNFFTAPEPAPAANSDLSTQLTIAFAGRQRTIHQPWLPEFAPVRAYVEQLIFLAIASADANAPTPVSAVPH